MYAIRSYYDFKTLNVFASAANFRTMMVVAVIGSGLIGSYTIVSPLTYDSLVIGIQGSWSKAFIHSVGAMLACITSASIGLLICGAL